MQIVKIQTTFRQMQIELNLDVSNLRDEQLVGSGPTLQSDQQYDDQYQETKLENGKLTLSNLHILTCDVTVFRNFQACYDF